MHISILRHFTGEQTAAVSGSLESVWKNTYMASLWFAVCTEGIPSQSLSCGPLLLLLSAHWNHPLSQGSDTRQCLSSIADHRSGYLFKSTQPQFKWGSFYKFTKGGADWFVTCPKSSKKIDTSEERSHVDGDKRLQYVEKCSSTDS